MRIDRGYGFEDVPVVEDHDHDEDRAWEQLPEERAKENEDAEQK